MKTVPRLLKAFRLTPGKTCSRQRNNRQKSCFCFAFIRPTSEEIDLFLHREETADLLEERFEIVLGHRPCPLHGGHKIRSIQPASATDKLIEQRQALLVRGLIAQISTDQIQNSERQKSF